MKCLWLSTTPLPSSPVQDDESLHVTVGLDDGPLEWVRVFKFAALNDAADHLDTEVWVGTMAQTFSCA